MFGLHWHFWAAAFGTLAAFWLVYLASAGRDLDRQIDEAAPISDDPDEHMAPLREPHGRHSRLDLTERRIKLAYRTLDRISRGKWLP